MFAVSFCLFNKSFGSAISFRDKEEEREEGGERNVAVEKGDRLSEGTLAGGLRVCKVNLRLKTSLFLKKQPIFFSCRPGPYMSFQVLV